MNNKAPLFSIIIPVYGVEAFLPQCIESVLSQSVSDWELILVDDGSKDRSGAICDEYAARDSRIRVIHKENDGPVSARQTGTALCQGSYVLYLDGDDYWDSELLAELQAVISSYHPDCISFGFRQVTESSIPICERHILSAEGLYLGDSLEKLRDAMLYDPDMPDTNKNVGKLYYGIVLSVFRKEIVAPIHELVPKHIRLGEDAAVTIPAALKCKSIYYLDSTKYNYRIREGSLSRVFSPTHTEEIEQLYEYLKEYANQLPARNLGSFLYRHIILCWVAAARSLPNYREFRNYVSDSFRIVADEATKCISKCSLKPQFKLQLFIVRHHLWYLFWLFYHSK